MEINILQKTKTKLKLEVKGEDHTLLNLIKKELYNDKALKYAGYRIAHVHASNPEFIIETDGKDPKKVLVDAVSRIKKINKELLSKFKKI